MGGIEYMGYPDTETEGIDEFYGIRDELEGVKADEIKIDDGIEVLNNQNSTAGEYLSYGLVKEGSLYSNFVIENRDNKLSIDFRCGSKEGKINGSAEMNIGLADILTQDVRKVRIIGERHGREYDMVGERDSLKGGFYDENGKYLPIFHGFQVEILKTENKQELNEKFDLDQKKFEKNELIEQISKDYTDELVSKLGGNEETQKNRLSTIIETAQNYSIDPNFLLSLLKVETEVGGGNLDFGIMNGSLNTFEGQLVMACRKIQHLENRFKMEIKDYNGRYNEAFLVFLVNYGIFEGAVIGYYGNKKRYLEKLMNCYTQYTGKYFDTDVYDSFTQEFDKDLDYKGIQAYTSPEEMYHILKQYIGTGYVRGGQSQEGIDCSGLIVQAMRENGVVDFGYDNNAQGLSQLVNKKNVEYVDQGDLVFLYDKRKRRITHVEFATDNLTNRGIPILDASSTTGQVQERYQSRFSDRREVIVGTPAFYA